MTVDVVSNNDSVLTFNYVNDDFRPYICNNFFGSRIFSFQFAENDSNRLNLSPSQGAHAIIILFPIIVSIVVTFVQKDLLVSFFAIFPLCFLLLLLPNHFLRPRFEA